MYLVKASFLALCWSIFKVSARFRKAWWTIAAYTFISFWSIFLSQLWQCGTPSDYADGRACDYSDEHATVPWILAPTVFGFALHISSEILILALPMPFIKKMQISRAQKFSVAGIFAIVIIDIGFGILRNSFSLCNDLGSSPGKDTCYFWDSVFAICEPTVAVLVCALSAYRALLPSSGKRRNKHMELQRNAANMGEATPRELIQTLEAGPVPTNEPETVSTV